MLTFWACPTSWVPSREWCICGPSPSTSRSRGSGQCWGAAGTSAFPPPRWNAAAPPWSVYGSAQKSHTCVNVLMQMETNSKNLSRPEFQGHPQKQDKTCASFNPASWSPCNPSHFWLILSIQILISNIIVSMGLISGWGTEHPSMSVVLSFLSSE